MKNLIIILLLIISAGCNKQDFESFEKDHSNQVIDNSEIIENNTQDKEEINNDEPINIYLFWGNGCHACANLKEFFNNLDSSYNKYFNLVQYEVWHNEDNQKLMHEIGEKLNETYYAVPYLVIGDEVIVGFSEAKKNYILDKIIDEYNNDRIDIMEKLKD